MQEQEERERKVVEYFFEHPTETIIEISAGTGISKSTVQRYLQKYGMFKVEKTGKTIREQLEANKIAGRRKGGLTTFKKFDHIQDETGKFIGNQSSSSAVDKELRKLHDIRVITNYFLMHPDKKIDEISSALETMFKYTSSYIYKCLNDNRLVEVIGVEKATQIREYLSKNIMSFNRKTNGKDLDLTSSLLSPIERQILLLRKQNKSLDEISEELNLSRARIIVLEDRAIEKLNESKESKLK